MCRVFCRLSKGAVVHQSARQSTCEDQASHQDEQGNQQIDETIHGVWIVEAGGGKVKLRNVLADKVIDLVGMRVENGTQAQIWQDVFGEEIVYVQHEVGS